MALGFFIFSGNHNIELQKTQRLAWRWDKKGRGRRGEREENLPLPSVTFLTLTPTLLVATSTLLKSSSVFRITVGSLCTDAPLPSEGRGEEGCFCTQDKSWRRQLRSPQEYAYAEGYHKRPFSSWNGSRRKYWPKGKYQGKKTGWYITHLYNSQKIDLFFCPILRKWYICNKGRHRLFF